MWPSIKCLHLIRLINLKITGNLSLYHLWAFQQIGRNTHFSAFLDLRFLDWLPYYLERLLLHKLCRIYNLYSSYMIVLQKLITKLHLSHTFQEPYCNNNRCISVDRYCIFLSLWLPKSQNLLITEGKYFYIADFDKDNFYNFMI
jgi:hypothetical protein